ncbi:UDP-N-acetylmuramoyl-L-alanyl-D-glutamate--2, 6-diaminopimelate ligase [Candidatus Kinetoplastibacterium sorsogonicusi]|uniref:Multifunctional fusion protein n=1 Tax=Candidatus Kinetoplastidibacterium kentomonadis TaxID=1576550 RepID=A0A3S7JAF2_9PROT|nr:UDP-N-acetylmuramoyl-L-alanyl-D-glutamate--2,6-diaminopimelate ligase [Candidatus Kinetoplastibacterium sorsogonicusi]AWD32662.1 UDP-N-acetylmuramoyl-L-alanyl-D-glutamate--2, 6-diaminopimelate ligase [Candidatus Kinetoplastibacterium sorsogonicusi]
MINTNQNDDIYHIVKLLIKKVSKNADLYINSKDINFGDVFVCCVSFAKNNHNSILYIQEAINLGAKAIIYDKLFSDIFTKEFKYKYEHLLISVKNLSDKLSALSNIWYDNPSNKLKVIAITGTNGKTSCANWIANILNYNNILCGVIGTLGYKLPNGQSYNLRNTTPDVISLNRILSKMVLSKAKFVVLEASSIGIEQNRLGNIKIYISCFTNLTRDHLDYHKSMSHYKESKLKLFKRKNIEHIVINIDDNFSKDIIRCIDKNINIIKYSINKKIQSNIFAYNIKCYANKTTFYVSNNIIDIKICTPILGVHNIYNLLLVISVLIQLGLKIDCIASLIKIINYVEGRLQKVEINQKLKKYLAKNIPLVIIDYAHTPDALQTALTSLKPLMKERKKGKICCIFGCGGSRDKGKRHLMFKIALKLADKIIITTDNPRYEDPNCIIKNIISGYNVTENITIITDRAEAIMSSIWNSHEDDIILIAGKGHEKYQEIEGEKHFFDDYQWATFSLLLYNSNIDFSIDSRTIKPGNIFIAIKGKNFDGHQFLNQVKNNLACAAIVDHFDNEISLPQIKLGDDTNFVLKQISKSWRKRFDIPLIAVVGSNGKTTTTQIIALILSEWYGRNNYLSTIDNFNNEIGVPITLLRMKKNHLAAVIEIGMNHINEIKPLSDLCSPNIVIITNAQREHQEFLISIENVVKENGSAVNSLSESGTIILPGDDNYSNIWNSIINDKNFIKFGLYKQLDVYADNIKIINDKTESDLFINNNIPVKLKLNIPGIHNIRNALAAISGCLVLKIPIDFILESIKKFQSIYGRLQFCYIKNFVLINDTYNANPDSFESAIDVLSSLSGIKILICGDMGEVGLDSYKLHFDIGAYAKKKNIDFVISVGKDSEYISDGFGDPKLFLKNSQEIINFLKNINSANILIKGSRFMHMEQILDNIYNYLNKE